MSFGCVCVCVWVGVLYVCVCSGIGLQARTHAQYMGPASRRGSEQME